MTNDHSARAAFLGPIALGFTYFILAFASLLWTRGHVGIATMWPAGGLAVAMLSIADRRLVGRYAVAVAFGSMAANVASGTSVLLAGIFTVANVVETLVAVILLSRCPFGRPSFVDVRQVACFCAIAAIASVASTVMACAAVGWTDWRFSLSWFATDFLGIVIVSPLAFIAAERWDSKSQKSILDVRPGKLAVSLALVAVVATITFAQSTLPLLFLPLAALLGATYASGPLGAAAGTMVIALIGSAALTLGVGPTVLIHGMPGTQAFFLQFYLVVLLGCALPMAALQTTRDSLVANLTERNRLLFMAERVAKIGHWHLDLASERITWSQEVFRIHGFEGDEGPTLDAALAAYHEEDREGLTAVLTSSISTGSSFRHRARIVRQDGEIRHVDVSGEVAMADGTAMSIFGVVQDVTRQVDVELRLEAAREDALATADRATVLAETDALTGLANRRRALEALAAAIRRSEEAGVPLSVAMFDIDHFKRVNDVHGHAVGDAVLQRVAASARQGTRATDLVGRLGGEEFVILLPGAGVDAAMEAAERLRARVESDGTDGPGDPRVTASVGVATLASGEDMTSLMQRADLALYQAKAEGRNASRLAA